MANEAQQGAFKSGVILKLLPEQIIVKSGDNGRYVDPDRRPLILKIMEDGRVNVPLVGRKIEQNQVQLVAGYGRHAAGTFINLHLTDGVLTKMIEESGRTGITVPVAPIKLPIILETMSAEEAFLRNISENDDRTATTFVDKAFNIRKAIQVFGKTEDEARYLYPDATGKPKSAAWVSQMLKITTLGKDILADIVVGERSANVAFALADMPEEARGNVLALAKQTAAETGTAVTATSVVAAARTTGAKTATVGRKLKEAKTLFEEHKLDGAPYHCREFCKTFLAWVADEVDDAVMSRAFYSRFKESPKDSK
jgi:hypothetical protein